MDLNTRDVTLEQNRQKDNTLVRMDDIARTHQDSDDLYDFGLLFLLHGLSAEGVSLHSLLVFMRHVAEINCRRQSRRSSGRRQGVVFGEPGSSKTKAAEVFELT